MKYAWWGGWRGWLKWLALALPVLFINSSIFYGLLMLGIPPYIAYWLSVPLGSLPTYIICTAIMKKEWK